MVEFNPLIEKKVNESDIPNEIKRFLGKVFALELQNSSEGTLRYRYGDVLDSEIHIASQKFEVDDDEI